MNYAYLCTGQTGQNTIIANSSDGLTVGMGIDTTYGIPSNTTITNIATPTSSGTIITLNNNLSQNVDSLLIFRPSYHPYTYTSPISLSTSEMLDEYTYKFTFSSPWVTPVTDTNRGPYPFTLGQPIQITGVTNTFYNKSYGPIGVIKCTDTYVICRSDVKYSVQSSSTGGTASFNITTLPYFSNPAKLNFIHTDCNSIATVFNGTDRVFITGQMDLQLSYTSTTLSKLSLFVVINRYKLEGSYVKTGDNQNQISAQFVFDKTLTGKQVTYIGSGSGVPIGTNLTLPSDGSQQSFVFSSVIDNPPIGAYWYVIDTAYITTLGDLVITKSSSQLRSLTTQVVKQ